MTPKWPPNDPQWPPLTHQWTPSEPPMTTNDNQLGHFWFPDVVKWNFTFKFLKEPIFPQFYLRNFCINSQNVNFLVFFHKKLPPKINKMTIPCPEHSVELRKIWDNILPWFLNLLLKLAFFEKEAKKSA